jgi:hypothetical protein
MELDRRSRITILIERKSCGALLLLTVVGVTLAPGCGLGELEPDPTTQTAAATLVSAASITPRRSFRTGDRSVASAEFRGLADWAPPNLTDKQALEKLVPVTASLDSRAKAARTLAALPPESPLSVTILLSEPAFDWEGYRAADRTSQVGLLQAGRAVQRQTQANVRALLSAHGVSDIEDYATINHLRASMTPKLASALLQLPEVVDIQFAAKSHPDAAYSGLESTSGTLLDSFFNAGYAGATGHTTSTPARLAIIESNSGTEFNASHVGWKTSSGSSRIASTRNCGLVGCPTVATSSTGVDHATLVTWVAAGSIQAGQDSAFSGVNTVQQRSRSGHAGTSSIYWYGDGGNSDGVKRAIDQAITDGTDVINMSLSMGDIACNSTLNYSGINESMRAAMNAGIVILVAAGNGGNGGACNIGYPGLRPENLAVAALNSTNSATAYTALGIAWYSSMGSLPIRTFNGAAVTTAGVDISTPGDFTNYFMNGTNTYGTDTIGGTSLATPVMAGAAVDLRAAFAAIGWPYTDARGTMVNLLAMGDSWDATTGATITRMSTLSGAGRFRGHYPSSANLVAPWGWGWHAFNIAQGQTVTWTVWDAGPESSALNEWKWATYWDEPDLQNVADIDFYVYDTCPAGGGAPVLVAYDSGYSLRAHMKLTASQIRGRCLEMRAYGYAVPANGRVVYTADFFHSGTP